MVASCDELGWYDRARDRLRFLLPDRFPEAGRMAGVLDSASYYVCLDVLRRDRSWEEAIRTYVDMPPGRLADYGEALRREEALLQRLLGEAQAPSPLLDIGAGWGRLASLYSGLGLHPVYLEPESLGSRLMRRSGLRRVARGMGEAMPFPSGKFSTTLIGWVLHHNQSSGVDAAAILSEAARVARPGGSLLSIEPLSAGFDREQWSGLLGMAGLMVDRIHVFFETVNSRCEPERYALAVSTRSASAHNSS
jgi:SAM-dependent methyltransferase